MARDAVEGGLMMMMMRRRVWDPDADARNQSGENNALQSKETVKTRKILARDSYSHHQKHKPPSPKLTGERGHAAQTTRMRMLRSGAQHQQQR